MSRPDREPFSKDDAELALSVMLEPIAEGARVLWIGEPGAGAERMCSLAASVDALAGPRRTRSGKRGGNVRLRGAPPEGELFDLIVAADLDDEGRVGELVQWLDARGALAVSVLATPGSYERLENELGRLFGPGGARIVGQTRFAGFALVDFAHADGGEVTFDGTAVDDTEAPVRWVALAGAAALTAQLAPYLVVQTPAGEGTSAPAEKAAEKGPEKSAEKNTEKSAERSLERPTAERGALEREVEAARARLEHAEKRLEQAQREIARSSQKLDELRHQLDEATAVRAALAEQLEAARREGRALEARVQAAERGSLSPAEAEEIEAAYEELELRLREQAGELTVLRGELERRATLVRDLVEELGEARRGAGGHPPPPPAPSAETLSELDRLKAQLAGLLRRVADAEAQRAAALFGESELKGRLERAEGQLVRVEAERVRLESERARLESERARAESERARLAGEVEGRSTLLPIPAGPDLDVELAKVRAEMASSIAAEREQASTRAAAAEGRVRGLHARIAELDERRTLAEARVALLEADLAQARSVARHHLADLESTREALALARMQPPGALDDARKTGELLGALSRAREGLAAAQEERDGLVRELARVRAGLLTAEQEASAGRDAALRDLVAARSEVEVLRASEAAAKGALVELRAVHESRLAALDALEGERNGLSFRLADALASLSSLHEELDRSRADHAQLDAQVLEARQALSRIAEKTEGTLADGEDEVAAQVLLLENERAEARKIGILLGDVERDLELIRKERDLEAARAAAAEAALGASQNDERARAAALLGRVAARDGLISSLQSMLAAQGAQRQEHQRELAQLEERLFREGEQRAAEAAVQEVQRAEDVTERAQLAEALSAAKVALDEERGARGRFHALLRETRGTLARLTEGLRAPEASSAPESLVREENATLRRELDDRGLMLRSLTAQLEERDERLRALEAAGSGQATQMLQQALDKAAEREARLVRELELAAERRTAAMEREAEVRRLEQELESQGGQLMSVEGRLEQSQRAEAGLRDQLAKVGSELESVIARAGSDAPAATLERLSQVLRALRR